MTEISRIAHELVFGVVKQAVESVSGRKRLNAVERDMGRPSSLAIEYEQCSRLDDEPDVVYADRVWVKRRSEVEFREIALYDLVQVPSGQQGHVVAIVLDTEIRTYRALLHSHADGSCSDGKPLFACLSTLRSIGCASYRVRQHLHQIGVQFFARQRARIAKRLAKQPDKQAADVAPDTTAPPKAEKGKPKQKKKASGKKEKKASAKKEKKASAKKDKKASAKKEKKASAKTEKASAKTVKKESKTQAQVAAEKKASALQRQLTKLTKQLEREKEKNRKRKRESKAESGQRPQKQLKQPQTKPPKKPGPQTQTQTQAQESGVAQWVAMNCEPDAAPPAPQTQAHAPHTHAHSHTHTHALAQPQNGPALSTHAHAHADALPQWPPFVLQMPAPYSFAMPASVPSFISQCAACMRPTCCCDRA